MKFSYDRSVDAAYIKLNEPSDWFPFGFTYTCDYKEVGGEINLDFDGMGRLIGIEVLQASKKLPPSIFSHGISGA